MTTTTIAAPPRVLGFWAAVSIVMGNMIGSGVFLLPASLAAYRGLSLAGWMVSAAGAVMLALVFARLSGQYPAAGGLYAYTRAAFGDTAGFLVAWGYWLSTVGTLAALSVAMVGYLDPFAPSLVRAPTSAALLAIGTIWIVTGVNAAGVALAGRVQIVTTALKLLPLAVVMIDIDWFKDFNDSYGHQRGDDCLRQVAAALADGLSRTGDAIARYGGEEFAVILPATDLEGAVRVAEQLRRRVQALGIPNQASQYSGVVTVSCGVAAIEPNLATDSQVLVAAADRALYEAKKAGRNRVIAAR